MTGSASAGTVGVASTNVVGVTAGVGVLVTALTVTRESGAFDGILSLTTWGVSLCSRLSGDWSTVGVQSVTGVSVFGLLAPVNSGWPGTRVDSRDTGAAGATQAVMVMLTTRHHVRSRYKGEFRLTATRMVTPSP